MKLSSLVPGPVKAAVLAGFIALVALRGWVSTSSPGPYDMGSGQMFDTIAPQYDFINKLMSLGQDMQWRQALIDALQLRAGDRVLDLATGTADVAILVGERLREMHSQETWGGPATVLGIDPSSNMIALGRQKVQSRDLSGVITLSLGDAQQLRGVEDGAFDKVTMSFGIRNVPDRSKALREIHRVLVKSPGSLVAIMDLHAPREGALALVAQLFIKYIAPALGYLVSGSRQEYQHLQRSIFSFPDPEEWVRQMRSAGLEVVQHTKMCFGVVHLYVAHPTAAVARDEPPEPQASYERQGGAHDQL